LSVPDAILDHVGQAYDVAVGGGLRGHGLTHPRVVELSVPPVAPRRGTAVAIGAADAEFLGAGPGGAAG
jgi:hypothetical protein